VLQGKRLAAIARSSPGGFDGTLQAWRDGKEADEMPQSPDEPAQPAAIVERVEPEIPPLRSKAYTPRGRRTLADVIAEESQREVRRDLLERAHDRTLARAKPMTRVLVGATGQHPEPVEELEVANDCSGPLTADYPSQSPLASNGLTMGKTHGRSHG
jgi:hypothetical protein